MEWLKLFDSLRMIFLFDSQVDPENSGIVTRVLNALFSHKIADQSQMQISFVEVYNNEAFDLLEPKVERPFFTKIRTTKVASKHAVDSVDEVLTLLSKGIGKRRVRETKMNSISSRSHVIFTIFLNVTQNENSIRPSVINLVDLAGSEGYRASGNTATEGKHINESLMTFKRVIEAMTSGPDKHIPYRESVVTHLLQSWLTYLFRLFQIEKNIKFSELYSFRRFIEFSLLFDFIGLH